MGVDLGNLSALRTFRVLRALKTVAVIPGEILCTVEVNLCVSNSLKKSLAKNGYENTNSQASLILYSFLCFLFDLKLAHITSEVVMNTNMYILIKV